MLCPQVLELSGDVIELREELFKASVHYDQEMAAPFQMDTSHLTPSGAERLLMECLVGREYDRALVTLRAVR